MYSGSVLTLFKSPLVIISFINLLFLTFPESKQMYSGSVLTLFKSPLVILTFFNLLAGSISLGFMDPTLAEHLKQVCNFYFAVLFAVSGAVWYWQLLLTLIFFLSADFFQSLTFSTNSLATLATKLATITHIRTWVIKIVTFKGGHLMW